MQLVCIRQRDDIPGVEVPDLESSRIVRRAIRVALQRGFDALGVRPSCIVHKVVVLHWLHACVAPGALVPIAKIGFALRLASCFMVPGEGRHHDFDEFRNPEESTQGIQSVAPVLQLQHEQAGLHRRRHLSPLLYS
jgi:hypothetical protein